MLPPTAGFASYAFVEAPPGGLSYAWNAGCCRPAQNAPDYQWSLETIAYPAENLCLADGAACEMLYDETTMAYRHNGGANLSFWDGHAKWLSQGAIPPAVGAAWVSGPTHTPETSATTAAYHFWSGTD
jgi:prepilin-type processing-associated H-X9-DG protein